jgi:hypothetical protein
LQQLASNCRLNDDTAGFFTTHNKEGAGIGIEFDAFRVYNPVLLHVEMANQYSRGGELIHFFVHTVHNKNVVVPGVEGDPLRVIASYSVRAEECPHIVGRADRSIHSWVQIIDPVAIVIANVVMAVAWIEGICPRDTMDAADPCGHNFRIAPEGLQSLGVNATPDSGCGFAFRKRPRLSSLHGRKRP